MIADRCYLYAIVAGAGPLPETLAGLEEAPISLVAYQDIAAAISPVGVNSPEPVTPHLLAHEAVIEKLMEQRSTLPVRFGSLFSHKDKVLEVLSDRYTVFKADLERLAGQVEVGLRVLWDDEAARNTYKPAPMSEALASDRAGTRYIRERLISLGAARYMHEQAATLEAWCRHRLQPVASEMRFRLLATEKMPVSGALLIKKERLDCLLDVVHQMECERPDLDLFCTGIWPPYHFVSGANDA